MNVTILQNQKELGKVAGNSAAQAIAEAIKIKGEANIILATGASQFDTLNQLIVAKDIDWSKVNMFHLDEYIGLSISHPASFRKYLQERFLAKVPTLKSVHLINGEEDAKNECRRLSELILHHPVDVALVGIGENGHLAFNDPPADFETEQPYIIVTLDALCKQQQMGEGWFNTIDEVPSQAISMSVKQILKSKHIVCSVPDQRKAVAVKNTLEQPVSNLYPASILQLHTHCDLCLDEPAASLLPAKYIASMHASIKN